MFKKTQPFSTIFWHRGKYLGKLVLWVLLWLALIDVSINLLFPYPKELNQKTSKLAEYFDYGRSIEGKLTWMVKADVKSSANMVGAGWLDPADWQMLPEVPEGDDDLLLAVYGMSFSGHVSRALADIDGKITVRSIGGPSAPINHSYAAFLADTGNQKADVVMVGILASSVIRTSSMTGIRWGFKHPAPHTYPYYEVNEQGKLIAVEPVITTADEFISAFHSRDSRWDKFMAQLKEHDASFDKFVFYRNITDYSAILRLIRRGWSKQGRSQSEKGLYDPISGFNPEAPEIKTLKVILSELSDKTTANGQQLVILLINDQGYRADLYTVLASHIEGLDDTLVLSTHTVVPAEDARNFLPDGHYTPESNRKLGQALQTLIRSESKAH